MVNEMQCRDEFELLRLEAAKTLNDTVDRPLVRGDQRLIGVENLVRVVSEPIIRVLLRNPPVRPYP